jgi:hypothetical protein
MPRKLIRFSRREILIAAAATTASFLTARLQAEASSPDEIAGIVVQEKQILLQLRASGKRRLYSFPVHADGDAISGITPAWEGDARDGVVTIDRFSGCTDRLFHRFRLFDPATAKPTSGVHFANDLRSLPSSPPLLPWPKSIKGVSCPVDIDDLKELGVRHTHINLSASAIVRVDPALRDDAFSRMIDGRRVWLNAGAIRALDSTVQKLTDAGINAVGVIVNHLVPGGVLTHPRTDFDHAPNKMGAFNLTTEEGAAAFRALIEFISNRYCRSDKRFGSVGGWIIGNEVQSHWEWHNLGRASLPEVTRQYADELRLAYFAMRNAGADVPVFSSFDHFWAMSLSQDASRHLPGRALFDAMQELMVREGSFPWHIAQHPYPENLFDPKFWNDRSATFSFASPRITFKNVEVLAAYLRRNECLCDGKPRRLIFSEQGFHAGSSPESERVQAAAYALAYRRLSQVEGVEAFILHRQVDAAAVGGLNLGIWPVSGTGAGKRKRPIWDVVKNADTPQWEAASNFALPIVGMRSWSQAQPRTGPFPDDVPKPKR